MELNVGWAMTLASPDELPASFEGNFDEQGTSLEELKKRTEGYSGEKGWDGLNAWATFESFDKDSKDAWKVEEIWQTDKPDVYNNGVTSLTVDATNAFLIEPYDYEKYD